LKIGNLICFTYAFEDNIKILSMLFLYEVYVLKMPVISKIRVLQS